MSSAPTAGRAFRALVWFTARRHARVRQLGWVSFGLLALLCGIIFVISNGPVGWRLEGRQRPVANPADEKEPLRMTYKEYGEERLPLYLALPGPPTDFAIRDAVASSYRALMHSEQFLNEYALLNYVRWTVRTLFFTFLMPLLCLAYATGSLGAERESRTLLWLVSRPLPRWALYLAKFLGTLPWCVAVSMIGFAVMCLAGGDLGHTAFAMYWDAVLIGSVAFAALFHLIGAVFRRPSVVGLVYVFFFETLVANLPGSLKQLSLSYYLQSLFYNETAKRLRAVQPQSVEVYAPAAPADAWAALTAATVLLTALGMYLFGRQEAGDEV
jgi:ABC-type transport system involved in multi-copper enzyme maturation permease subunit